MAWLVSEGRVLASLEVVDTARGRMRGLVGRECVEGALLLRPARGVHTFGVRFPIDVAFCGADMRVIDIVTMQPSRLGRPRIGARVIIETAAGCLQRWGVAVGDQLEVRA